MLVGAVPVDVSAFAEIFSYRGCILRKNGFPKPTYVHFPFPPFWYLPPGEWWLRLATGEVLYCPFNGVFGVAPVSIGIGAGIAVIVHFREVMYVAPQLLEIFAGQLRRCPQKVGLLFFADDLLRRLG